MAEKSGGTNRNNTRQNARRGIDTRSRDTRGTNAVSRDTRSTNSRSGANRSSSSAKSRKMRQREREKQVLKQRLILAAVIVAVVLIIILVWRLAGKKSSEMRNDTSISTRTTSSEVTVTPEPAASVTPEPNPVLQEPEAEDGTADAGIMKLLDDRSGSLKGWNENDTGRWYSPEDGTCYFNGWISIGNDTFHFDENGYAATGWTAISYRDGRFFADEGV